MEQLKTNDGSRGNQHLSHPLVIKMGGRQWVVGGENTTPVEMDKSDKLISLSTWTTQAVQSQSPSANKHPLRKMAVRYLDKLSVSLDGLLGMRRADETAVNAADGTPLQTSHTHSKSATKRRALRDTFQFGLTFGLALGCISVFLFHQLEPSHVYIGDNRNDTASAVLAGLSPGFTLPSMNLYTLQTTPFGSEKEALKVQSALAKQGIRTVVHQNQAYTLWCGMAIHSGALRNLKDELAKLHVNAREAKVAWHAQPIAGPSGESQATAKQISRWLAASASSVTTLTGVLSDGGLDRDATQAYETAKSLQPSGDAIASTGYQKELTEAAQDMNAAISEYRMKHRDEAIGFVVKACDALSRIQTSANTFS